MSSIDEASMRDVPADSEADDQAEKKDVQRYDDDAEMQMDVDQDGADEQEQEKDEEASNDDHDRMEDRDGAETEEEDADREREKHMNVEQEEQHEQEKEVMLKIDESPAFSKELLQLYYDRLFPFTPMFRWLSYGNDPEASEGDSSIDTGFFRKREFSMTLEGDVYLRFRSYKNKDEFRSEIRSKCPLKMDLGAYYNVPPTMKNSVRSFMPLQKEFVIDIDLTDYDDVRKCCSGASLCLECWPLMSAAAVLLDKCLRDDFGFEHLLWVYSGRRGIHCWVCDSRARVLTNTARTKVADYLSLYEGNQQSDVKISFSFPTHPSLERAYQLLLPYFESMYINRQDLLGSSETWMSILKFLPSDMRQTMEAVFSSRADSGSYRWKQVKKTVQEAIRKKTGQHSRGRAELEQCLHRCVFTMMYPRLDVKVSQQLNHLLKSPFCAHPKTGRVCVPVDLASIDTFNPLEVPTLGQLNDDLNRHPEGAKVAAKDTSLGPYISFFQRSFLEPLEKEIRTERAKHNRANSPGAW